MATDWIRIRRGIRQWPKTVAVSRKLAENQDFMDWWGVTARHETSRNVTFENVTRVTACALVELWFAINDVVDGDCWVPYMALSDVDDIVGVPGFGQALLEVGWVLIHAEKGLIFPNFAEHNVPHKMRAEPKSPAERSREYRERKRVTARHETSRREEKRREEKKEQIQPAAPVPRTKPATPPRAGSTAAVSWSADEGFTGITDADRQAWATAYPGAVLDQELAKASEWLKANPKRAGKRNWRKFIVGWLSRCQERGGSVREAGRRPEDPKPVDSSRRRYWRGDADTNMTDAEYLAWLRRPQEVAS